MANGQIDENSPVEEIRAVAIVMIIKARRLGYNVAADCLEAYIDGKTLIELQPSWLRSFSKVTDAEAVNNKRFEEAIEEYVVEIGSSTQNIYRYEGKKYHWDRAISYKNRVASTEELFYASGNSTLTSEPKLILKKHGNLITFRGTIYHYWHDIYDFHPGWKAWVPGVGTIPDAAMAKLRPASMGKLEMKSGWQQTFDGKILIEINSNTKIPKVIKHEFIWGKVNW